MAQDMNDKDMQKQFEERHENLKETMKSWLDTRGDRVPCDSQSSATAADSVHRGAKDAACRDMAAMKQANPEQFEAAAAKVDDTFGSNALTDNVGSQCH